MDKKDYADILRYSSNLFSFPEGYFNEHAAEELNISEEVRKELASMQNNALHNSESYENIRKREFLHTAAANGHQCGAERSLCGLSGRP